MKLKVEIEENERNIIELENSNSQIDIDGILKVYLNNNLIRLNQKQIDQIKQIIDPTTNNQVKNKETTAVTIELDEKEMFLHGIFSKQTEQMILKIMSNKSVQALLILTGIVWFIFANYQPFYTKNMLIFAIYSIIVNCTLWIPYALCYAISVNKKAVKYITKSFEFWLKMYYSFYWCLSYVLYNYFFMSKIQQWGYLQIRMIDTILLNGILVPLIIFSVSMFDGFGTNRKWKIFVSGFLGISFFVASIYYEFFSLQMRSGGDQTIIYVFDGKIAFSVLSMLVNSHQILGLFLCKQAFLTYWRKKKAVTMKVTPFLSWKRLKNEPGTKLHMQRVMSTSTTYQH